MDDRFVNVKICSNDSNIINKTYDHNPPEYIGTHTWNNDSATYVTGPYPPGYDSGLYRDNCPLNICNCSSVTTILTGVKTIPYLSIDLYFTYTDSSKNSYIRIEPKKIYTFVYIENGNVMKCTGMVTNIYKVLGLEGSTDIYKIKIDCSQNYSNSVIILQTDQIRHAKLYIPYSEEDSTILNSRHSYGTSIGNIEEAVITNATLDKNNNILEGTIVAGILHGETCDGIAEGENQQKHHITTIHGKTYCGSFEDGYVLSGIVVSGDVNGIRDPETSIVEKATVKGIIHKAVIVNSTIVGGKTTGGTVINPTLDSSIVVDAIVSGDDLITTGGITVGNITTGGTSQGGTAIGGNATGTINDDIYTIAGGTTIPKDPSKPLITVGGIVTGGTIIGGQHVGNTIINAIIKGGTVSGGTTTGGTTTGGTLIPTNTNEIPISKPIAVNPDYNKTNGNIHDSYTKVNLNNNRNNLAVWMDENGEFGTNLGTAHFDEINQL